MADKLSLLELEAFDACNNITGTKRRFLCPFPGCGDTKPRDAAHRSLGVNMETGLWQCNRCKRSGKLTDYWTCRKCGQRTFDGQHWTCSCKGQTTRQRQAQAAHQAFQRKRTPDSTQSGIAENCLKKETLLAADRVSTDLWQRWWQASCQLPWTPGARYLHRRGIPSELAAEAGVRYSADWYGWTNAPGPAVLFPLRDEARQLVAIDARFIDSDRKQAAGDKRLGVFVTPGWKEAPALAITEAPIDALSLSAAGVAAVALCGCSWPDWLVPVIARKPCLIALDADEGGDTASAKLQAELSRYSATTCRLRPKVGKDWNEVLLKYGLPALRRQLRGFSAELALTDGLDEIEARSGEIKRLALAGKKEQVAFLVQLLPLEWRHAIQRHVATLNGN